MSSTRRVRRSLRRLIAATSSAGASDIHRIHARARKRLRTRQRDAARSRAHVEQVLHARRGDPGREAPFDELGNGRAGNQHAFVDVERQAREPGLVA